MKFSETYQRRRKKTDPKNRVSFDDLFQPDKMVVSGHDLDATVHRLQEQGAFITALAQVDTNGTWRLSLYWPQQREAHE